MRRNHRNRWPLCVFVVAAAAFARGSTSETVFVGNPGNDADDTTYGAVAYPYRIGKYEVTNAEYCAFLNAAAKRDAYGLYSMDMAAEYGGIVQGGEPDSYSYTVKPGMADKPVNFVSWLDAVRYANWLTNGCGAEGTETGTYTIHREGNGWSVSVSDRAKLAAARKVRWALASENEWYKAAYYDPKKPGGAGYWDYATRSDSPPARSGPPGTAPAANYNSNTLTDGGAYKGSASAYGTFDQNGNLWEWNETRVGGKCGVRGGSFYLNDRPQYLRSATRYVTDSPSAQHSNYGFRVVALGGDPAREPAPPRPPEKVAVAKPAPTEPAPEPPMVKPADTTEPATPAQRTEPATFYVSQSSGNDSWTGLAPTPDGTTGPWKTLARASTDCIPGDRILLKCGDTWNEELHPKGEGTSKNPITVASYGEGNKPVIDRQDYNRDLIGIHLADQGGFKIVGIEFARCMTGIYGEYSDGCPTKRYIWIEDCTFRDSLKYGNYKNYPSPREIGLGICFFSYERDKQIVLADVMIKDCVFRRLASGVWTNSPDNFNKNAGRLYNFANLVLDGCLFEEGYQWQMGIRGVDGGRVRNCVTHDIGRGFRAWNGVAGAMFFRSRDWVFEDSEWGFVSIGNGSGDGEAFDFEGTCDNMTMRRCLFHDTDGPGFLLCVYASSPEPNLGILMEDCVINGKSKRPIGLPRCAIISTTDWNQVLWKRCRFYLSQGEALMRVMDPEKEKRTTFAQCLVKNLADACSTPNLALKATLTASSQEDGHEAAKAADRKAASWQPASSTNQWLELDFGRPTTVNEFRIREVPGSSVIRYVIQLWSERRSRWVGVFNGREIGPDFIAPIVSRTTSKARLYIVRTTNEKPPAIAEFEAYNDTTGTAP